MKKRIFADACTVAGASVGVGFLSGKEAQIFLGGMENTAIFGIAFFAFCLVLRNFCRVRRCADAESFCRACFGKSSDFFFSVLCVCCFVCAVTALSGLEECLGTCLPQFSLPAYSVAAALISAFLMKKGLGTLKILNTIQMIFAFVYVLAMFLFIKNGGPATSSDIPTAANSDFFGFFQNVGSGIASANGIAIANCDLTGATIGTSTEINVSNVTDGGISTWQPLKYALFNVTVSVGVLAPLSQTGKKQNVAATAVATLMLFVLICFVLVSADFSQKLPFFRRTDSAILNVFAVVTLTLATITGVVANLLPVTQFVDSVIGDKTLSSLCVFCLAVAFSMFGFDFALKYGYVFVAIFGAVTIAATMTGLARRNGALPCATDATFRRNCFRH